MPAGKVGVEVPCAYEDLLEKEKNAKATVRLIASFIKRNLFLMLGFLICIYFDDDRHNLIHSSAEKALKEEEW
jgi:hypothetical protein